MFGTNDVVYNHGGNWFMNLICFFMGHDKNYEKLYVKKADEKGIAIDFGGDPYKWDCLRCKAKGRLMEEFGRDTQ